MAIANLVATEPGALGDTDVSEGCNNRSTDQVGDSHLWNCSQLQPLTRPEKPQTHDTTEEEQAAWVSVQVQNLQAEIEALKEHVSDGTSAVAAADKRFRDLTEEYENYDRTTVREVNNGLETIKSEYNEKLESLKSRLMAVAKSVVDELDEEYKRKLDSQRKLKMESDQKFDSMTSKLVALGETMRDQRASLESNTLEMSRRIKGLACYKALVNYLDDRKLGS